MKGNRQTGLTHLHVYTLVIYRMERETVACIVITACRSPRKDTEQQFSRFSVNEELKNKGMEQSSISLRFNQNREGNALLANKEQNLLIGLISSIQTGLFVNSLETGMSKDKLRQMLAEIPQLKQESFITEMLTLLKNEGERTAYSILLPYLLSSDNEEEIETILRKRFFGIESFIQRAHHLHRFMKYIREKNIVSIEKEDFERGILAWDTGELITLARVALETGYIDEQTAWEYIRFAGEKCRQIFKNWEEIGKSYLIGQAMKTDKKEEIDITITSFLSATQDAESPWKKYYLSLSTT